MKNFLRNFGAGLLGGIVGLGLLGAAYNQFSPGGALSGTWNSQSVNVGSGAFITGTLPVANGGSGATTLTGLLQGNGSSPFTAITNSSTVGQTLRVTGASTYAWGALDLSDTDAITGTLPFGNGGTGLSAAADDTTLISSGAAWVATGIPNCPDTTGNHLNYIVATNSFACGTSAPGGFTGLANPTGTIGLTAVNGVATTAPRSDSAPALSQAIAPTWTGTHIFSNSTAWSVSSSNPFHYLNETDAAANGRVWATNVDSGAYNLLTMTDALASGKSVLGATRSGNAVSTVTLGNATDNPTLSFLGSGVVTSGGPFRAADGAVGAPSYSFTGDTDSGWYATPATPSISASVGNMELIRVANNTTTNVGVLLAGHVRFTSVLSPTALSANTDNWAPTGVDSAVAIRIDTTTPLNLTGISAQNLLGRMMLLINVSANTVTLVHDATSTAANRFFGPNSANVLLRTNGWVWIWYDVSSSRWRIMGA